MFEHLTEGCQCEGKQCPACEEVKCVGAFGKAGSKLRSRCKPCHASYQKQWRDAHPDYNKGQCHKYYHANAESLRDDAKVRYKRRDRDQENKRLKAYYQANPEKNKARHQRYYQANVEHISARIKAYRKAHPEGEKAVIRHNRRRTRKTQAGGHYTAQQWHDLKEYYGYTCLCCGRQEPEIKLTADHVIPVAELGTSDISNIQPLCSSCNSRKGGKMIDYRRVVSWQI